MGRYYLNTSSQKYSVGLKALSTYNRLAYKRIILELIPELKEGILSGETKDNMFYSVGLPCSKKFIQVHGKITLNYYVDDTSKIIYLDSIEPFHKLQQLHSKLTSVKDGVPIVNKSDLFKLNLYKSMEELDENTRTTKRI